MAAKAWRWLFAASISSPGTLGLGAETQAPQDTADDAPGIVNDETDRHSRRADRIIGDLVAAFNEGPVHLARLLDATFGDADLLRQYLEALRTDLAPLDVHSVRFLSDDLVIVTAQSSRDASWHQLTLALSPEPALRFIRVDPMRY
jgi:hypothetical protein